MTTRANSRNTKPSCHFMSFTDYLLIERKAVCVEHWTRKKSSRWSMTLYESLDDVVRIESINIAISLAEVYAGIDVGVD